MNVSRDRQVVHKQMNQIIFRLVSIERQQGKVIAELNEYLEGCVSNACAMQQLTEYISLFR